MTKPVKQDQRCPHRTQYIPESIDKKSGEHLPAFCIDKKPVSSVIIVEEGETLTRIAKGEGTTASDLVALNPALTCNEGKENATCHDAKGRKRSADGHWIYPGDEVVIEEGKYVISPPEKLDAKRFMKLEKKENTKLLKLYHLNDNDLSASMKDEFMHHIAKKKSVK